MIIDAHAHLGIDVVFDEEVGEDELLTVMRENNVDGAIVQPYIPRPYISDHQAIHDRIFRLTKNTEKRFWGMASINPHFRPEDYDAEAKRCIEELGFVAIKITPIAHACHPSSQSAFHVFEICRALDVPLMIHTGAGIPFADPMSCHKALEAFPDVTVILAHAGTDLFSQSAIFLAKKFERVYLEPSWVGAIGVGNMIRQLGCGKIMFSSDNTHQMAGEMAKYRNLIHDEQQLAKVLGGNAKEIFRLK